MDISFFSNRDSRWNTVKIWYHLRCIGNTRQNIYVYYYNLSVKYLLFYRFNMLKIVYELIIYCKEHLLIKGLHNIYFVICKVHNVKLNIYGQYSALTLLHLRTLIPASPCVRCVETGSSPLLLLLLLKLFR